ncbi:uncharacterized protein CTRU02_215506 [Colletotrichum truncatum]|uniref:Uncharacterized protein n=1 Tax=Colletotrichum truncatum TaxID=5467 RepID=A0ACC3YCT7_COLTU|nr:uncharacterized protein CTRU02_05548 [Colletotrichum truncatum]KAF6793991.1 hypothetical protein CTRU02_05548 [Colletotrichum truncatum]
MAPFLLIIFASFHWLAFAKCDSADLARWSPNPGETFDSILRPLGIEASLFRDLNEITDGINRIDYMSTYCVPYISSLSTNYYTTSGSRFFSLPTALYGAISTDASHPQSLSSVKTSMMAIQTVSAPSDTEQASKPHATDVSETPGPTLTITTSKPSNTEAGATLQPAKRRCCAQKVRDSDITEDFHAQAKDFCDKHGILNYYSAPTPKSSTGDIETNVAGEDFVFSISWLTQCVDYQVQNGLQPTIFDKDVTCESLMMKNIKECGSRTSNGGYVDVGCLRFSSRAKGWALDGV